MDNKQHLHIPEKLKPWIEARIRWRLSDAQIQMARELGMDPKKFGELVPNPQERWKAPLPGFIEECYRKQFGRDRPENVFSIENAVRRAHRKKADQRLRKLIQFIAGSSAETPADPASGTGTNRADPETDGGF